VTTPLRRLLATVACAAALVVPLLVAGPATADTEVKNDPRGDVQSLALRAPRPSADILRLTSTHADGVVAGRIGLVDLDTTSFLQVGFGIGTAGGDRYVAILTREEGEVGTMLVTVDDSETVWCPQLAGRVLPAADRVAIEVPRACVDRPRWVRTGAVTIAGAGDDDVYFDDARRDGTLGANGIALGTRRLFLN
jgi:hypothetical protein